MAAVVFDPDEFRELYPQLADFSDVQLTYAFDVACVLLDNSGRSRVRDEKARKIILYLLVCHLCELSIRGGGIVGSMTSASQGSVSAGFAAPTNPDAQWYNQTQCGATAWQLMSAYTLGGKLYNGCHR